jgi:hypothetical protein
MRCCLPRPLVLLAALAALPVAACSETPEAPLWDRISSTEAPTLRSRTVDGGASGGLMFEGVAPDQDGSQASGHYQFAPAAPSGEALACAAEPGRRSTCPGE